MPDFDPYMWLILPVLIFLARVCDVSLATIRLIFISRGYKFYSIEDADFVEEGTFPIRSSMRSRVTDFIRKPLRKGK